MSVDDDTLGRLVILSVVVVGLSLGSTVMAAETQNAKPEIIVTDVQVGVGETVQASIRLSSVPNGLAGYNITVTTGDNVEIVNASLNDELRLTRTKITDDGQHVVLRGVDLEKKVESGAGQVTLATVTLRGKSSGDASLEVTVGAIDDDSGSAINPTIDNATVKIGQTNNMTSKTSPTTNSDTPKVSPTTDNTTSKVSPTTDNATSKVSPTSTDEIPKVSPTSTDNATSMGTSNGGSGSGRQTPLTPAVVVMVIIALLALVGLLWVAR